MSEKQAQKPGDGIRSMRSTSVFRLINFELYTKPNKIIMGLGLAALTGVFGYIAYMRYKYENLGYYVAVREDGREEFVKKKSNWET
ncbi:small integral membrane protein 8 [Drosophila novamexicana]|uniref:small integral membrane protein 8 n=1 Tax=Drosophila novamexicana TaxID=47314 RepID=UPI0011E5A2EE|nr:small integral membrane protein 8 [Drosophila novamexicana]